MQPPPPSKEVEKSRPDLPEKRFEIRESILTKVYKIQHVKSVQNLAISAFILLAIRNAINDIYYGGQSELGLRWIRMAFGKFPLAIAMWITMFGAHVAFYFGWKIWYKFRTPMDTMKSLWDVIWLSVFFVALFGTFHMVAKKAIQLELPMGSFAAVLAEQTRFLMKNYAFVRTSSEQVLTGKKSSTFRSFLYFSFAPTLIYRNEYPRTPTRSWRTVGKYFMELMLSVYFLSLLETEIIQHLYNFGTKPFTLIDIVYTLATFSVHSFIFATILAQISLHSSQNTFAEITRFGDRQFHKDWWTSTNLSEFYTTWNVIVQDWLFYYVYRDFYKYVTIGNKMTARLSVFMLSIVMHEVLFIYVTKLMCPVFSLSMLISLPLMIVRNTNRKFNLLMMLQCMLGNSILLMFPNMEFFAKINCPTRPASTPFYIPYLYSCHR